MDDIEQADGLDDVLRVSRAGSSLLNKRKNVTFCKQPAICDSNDSSELLTDNSHDLHTTNILNEGAHDNQTSSDDHNQNEVEIARDIEGKLEVDGNSSSSINSTTEMNKEVLAIVNVLQLKPKPLFKMPVIVNNKCSLEALIDSGSSENLIRLSAVKKLKVEVDNSARVTMLGLGSVRVTTLGVVDVSLSFLGVKVGLVNIKVVEDKVIHNDLVLGIQFLKEQNITVDMGKNKITKINTVHSKSFGYFDKEGILIRIIHEKLPVYADCSSTVKGDELIKVPIANLLLTDQELNKHDYLFECNIGNKSVTGVDGIINDKSEVFL